MPLEINEIGIRLRVRDDEGGGRGEPQAAGDGTLPLDRDEIVAACVQQVLRVLKSGRER